MLNNIKKRLKGHESMSEGDVDFLETMLPGLQVNRLNTYTEDQFLTELLTPEDLSCILLPFSRKRNMWDLLTLMLVLYTALVLPYVICFPDSTNWTPPQWMDTVDIISDIVFMCVACARTHASIPAKPC